MVSFGDGLTNGLKSAYCAWFQTVDGARDWAARTSVLPFADPAGDAADAWYTYTCGTEQPPPSPLPPPFTGGQCPVAYRVFFVASSTPGYNESREAFINGPVEGTRYVLLANGNYQFQVFGPNGGTSVTLPPSAARDGGITSTSRLDGLPDNCGDPPLVIPPITPIDIDIDVDYDGGTIINAPVSIGPFFVGIGGNVYAPVEINLPDVNLTGNINITPDFNFEPNFDFNFGEAPTGPGSEPNPSDPSGPGISEPEEPEEEPPPDGRIIAVLCTGRIESDARPSGIAQDNGPDIYAPRLGSVRFGTIISGAVFWSPDIPIKGLRSVIPCPIEWGASTAVVNADPGVALNWVPIRAAPPEWPPALELGGSVTVDNR